MPFNGTGIFNRLYNWQQDAVNGINIMADRMDAEMDGYASGLSICLTRDGQSIMQAPLDMGGFKILRLGTPSVVTDAMNLGYFKDNPVWTIDGSNILTFDTQPVFGAGFKVGGAIPQIIFEESDQVDPAGRWRLLSENNAFVLQKAAVVGGFTSAVPVFTATASTSLITWGSGWALGATIFKNGATFEGIAPVAYFVETDQTDPAGRFRFIVNGDAMTLQRATAAAWASAETVWNAKAGTTPKQLDVSYNMRNLAGIQVQGGDIVSNGVSLRIKVGSGVTGVASLLRQDSTNFYLMFTADGDADGSFNTLRPLSVDKTTGVITLGHLTKVNAQLYVGDPAGTSQILYQGTNNFNYFDRQSGSLNFRTLTPSVVSDGILENTTTAVNSVKTIITAEKGDARYVNLTGGSSTITGPVTLTGGLLFGSVNAATIANLTKHISLYSTTYGFNVTANQLNHHVPTGAKHLFHVNAVNVLTVDATGWDIPSGWRASSLVMLTPTDSHGVIRSQGTGRTHFQVGTTNVARVDPEGTTAGSTLTVMTREKGDARYGLLTGGNTFNTTDGPNQFGNPLLLSSLLSQPVLGFIGDEDTGIGRHQANGITFFTNNIERVRIGANLQVMSPGTYFGDGSTLTALNASELTTGTVAAARLPTDTAETTRLKGLISNFVNGDLGSYAFLYHGTVGTAISWGQNLGGSALLVGGSSGDLAYVSATVPSGSWKAMCAASGAGRNNGGIMLRVL